MTYADFAWMDPRESTDDGGGDFPFDDLRDGTHRCTLRDGREVFAKIRRDVAADFFAAEARGLRALAAANAVRVPGVLALAPYGIALEDLGSGHASARAWEEGGRRLALLHRSSGAHFGFDAPGYCGDSPQDNTPDDDGFRFFAERRVLPQMRHAFDAGLLDASDRACIERLCAGLRDRLPAMPPVLVHGDLWFGNLHVCANGEVALIDGGAVHFGWADADLAMLTLFGEPPPCFFSSYEAESGRDAVWRAHAPLLNVYHLLNHLNLFGSGYLGAVRRACARYA